MFFPSLSFYLSLPLSVFLEYLVSGVLLSHLWQRELPALPPVSTCMVLSQSRKGHDADRARDASATSHDARRVIWEQQAPAVPCCNSHR